MKNKSQVSFFKFALVCIAVALFGVIFAGLLVSIFMFCGGYILFTTGKNPFSDMIDPVGRNRNCY